MQIHYSILSYKVYPPVESVRRDIRLKPAFACPIEVGDTISPFEQDYKYRVLSISIIGGSAVAVDLQPVCENAKKMFRDQHPAPTKTFYCAMEANFGQNEKCKQPCNDCLNEG